jgi:hypothetical protein
MKSSTILVLMAALLALSFSTALAEDACTDLRACVENCTQIKNCTMFMNCLDNCTMNATAAFEESKGYCVGSGCLGMGSRAIIPRPIPEASPVIPNTPEPVPQTFDSERIQRLESNGEGYEPDQHEEPGATWSVECDVQA